MKWVLPGSLGYRRRIDEAGADQFPPPYLDISMKLSGFSGDHFKVLGLQKTSDGSPSTGGVSGSLQ